MPKIALLAALFLLSAPAGAAAVDRFVNPNDTCTSEQVAGNPEHDTIQGAVDASSPGDVILVCPDTYQETVVIAVDDLSLLGLPPVLLQPRTPAGPCIVVDAANVAIRRFEIAGCHVGIDVLATAIGGLIANNTLHDNETALRLNSPLGLVAQNNLARDNIVGIEASGDDTQVNNNTVRNNLFGIFLHEGSGLTAFKNRAQNNLVGIGADFALSCVMSFNSVSLNVLGIAIFDSDGCAIQSNNASRNDSLDCGWDGTGTNTFLDNNCRAEEPPGAWTRPALRSALERARAVQGVNNLRGRSRWPR
jgi:parallel beta-helix repeat protein